MKPNVYEALQKLEKQAEADYFSARKHHPIGAEWDKGYWEGIKDAIKVVIEQDAD